MTDAAFALRVFDAVDRMDAAAFARFLTPDARLRFASADPVYGREAAEKAVAAFFQSIAGMEHRLVDLWRGETSMVCRLDVTYYRHRGDSVEIPAMTLWRMNGPRIADYEIFNDLSPVFRG